MLEQYYNIIASELNNVWHKQINLLNDLDHQWHPALEQNLFLMSMMHIPTSEQFFYCACVVQVRLLCVATQHSDLESTRYLLKEACITVPQEPSSSHPAILAAYYGHSSLVKELLDSIPGRRNKQHLLHMGLHSCRPISVHANPCSPHH